MYATQSLTLANHKYKNTHTFNATKTRVWNNIADMFMRSDQITLAACRIVYVRQQHI